MGNMSYCRFQNTQIDLSDCEGALEEILNTEPGSSLSVRELRAAKELAMTCARFVNMIAEYGELYIDELEEFEKMHADALDKANTEAAEHNEED